MNGEITCREYSAQIYAEIYHTDYLVEKRHSVKAIRAIAA